MTAASRPDLPDAMLPELVRIAEVTRETHDTCTITTVPVNGAPLPVFAAGQFSMLYAYGVGEMPISISGDPETPDQLVYTIRAVGKGSEALIGRQPGDCIAMRGPFGTRWPLEAAKGGDVLLVAGGIGLAPLRPVIYYIARHRSEYGRLVVLYGARSPKELLFGKQLRVWSALPDTQVLTTVDYGGSNWRGNVGVVTKLFGLAALRPDRTTAMMCGPEIMMRFVVRQLKGRKIAADKIYLSMERNMKCAAGFCGHCQMGPYFICKDGPVFSYPQIRHWMEDLHEL